MGHPTAEVSERVRAKLRVAELGRALEARLSGTYWEWGQVVILGGAGEPYPWPATYRPSRCATSRGATDPGRGRGGAVGGGSRALRRRLEQVGAALPKPKPPVPPLNLAALTPAEVA